MKRSSYIAILGCGFAALSVSSASAKCVTRTVPVEKGKSASFTAVIPDDKSAASVGKGYVDTSCDKVDKRAYRERVCSPKLIGNRGVQRQLEAQAGISFAELCSSARLEAGLAEQVAQRPVAFSPSNERQEVAKADRPMVGPLGANATTDTVAGEK